MAAHSDHLSSYGLLQCPGIPTPTGPYNVGCIDIMTDTGLLIRLFYPANNDKTDTYQYVPATPHPRYTRASFEIFGFQPVGLMTCLINYLTGNYITYLYLWLVSVQMVSSEPAGIALNSVLHQYSCRLGVGLGVRPVYKLRV